METLRTKRKRDKKRKVIGITLLSVLTFFGLLALIGFKVFTVQNVIVEGNEHYSDQAIQDWVLNDEHSWNTLYVYFKHRFQAPRELPFVDSMEVTIRGVHTIGIEVFEKGLLGYVHIANLGQNADFDNDGFVVETSSQVIEGSPRVTGLELDQVVLYEKLPIGRQDLLKNLLSLTHMLKKYDLLPNVIAYGEDRSFTLDYGEITVLLGQYSDMNGKVLRLSNIKPQLTGHKGVLHLDSWTEDVTDVTFKEAE
jgi:cell division protein FtsQ